MHSLRSAVVQYTNYGTGGAFELPTQSGTLAVISRSYVHSSYIIIVYLKTVTVGIHVSYICCNCICTHTICVGVPLQAIK